MSTANPSTTRTWFQPSRKVGRLATVLGALFFFGVGLFSLVMAPFTDMPWATGTLALFPFAIGFFLLSNLDRWPERSP